MSFFRYPGGKGKLKKIIVKKLLDFNEYSEYREPFFGGGSILPYFISQKNSLKNVWINDFDFGISCLWTTLIRRPDLLKKRVKNFIPTVEAFETLKKELLKKHKPKNSDTYIANIGFKKLAVHQTSYSGLGVKSGGPLGGKLQKSKYKIDCRWSPDYICEKIDCLNESFSNLNFKNDACTNVDFSELILNEDNKALIYLDPPYYNKGNDLYQHGFSFNDHVRLSELLRKTNHHWVLSYDDTPEIRKLYSWAKIEEINVNYTITSLKDRSSGLRSCNNKNELLIF